MNDLGQGPTATSFVQKGNASFALPSSIEAGPVKKIQARGLTVRNLTPRCYGMHYLTVSAAQSRYRQPLLLQDLVISLLADQDVSLPTVLHMAQTS